MTTPRFTTTAWPEAVRCYEQWLADAGEAGAPMLDLVRFIAGSPHASGLFPVPAPDILRIGRVRNFPAGDNELRIGFDSGRQEFLFVFLQRPGEAEPWSRTCTPGEARQAYERLLHKKLRWFHEG